MNGSNTHILYVITDLELGGVPLHLLRLAVAMRKRGFRPTVVSLAPPGPVGDRLRDEDIPVFGCDGRGGWDVRVIKRLAAYLRDLEPDLVHALLFHANVAARLAGWHTGLPASRLVCEIQTVEVERRWHLAVDRWTHRLCRCTVGNSPSVIEHLATEARIPRDRLHLVQGGIDPTRVAEAEPIDRVELGLSSADRMILWVGRIDPVKGLDLLLDAFQRLADCDDLHLVLAGDGPIRGQLTEQARNLGLVDHVHWLGARDDVGGLYRSADLFVFPSRTEGLPNALMEAMAAGCPIVTTDVAGCRDLIEHDETGVVVPFGDVSALAGAMQELLEDRGRARCLGEEASRRVASDWHIGQSYDRYAALYAQMLGQETLG